MAPSLSVSSTLKQEGVLAPQMRQSLEMLQATALDLGVTLRQQMLENPIIESVTSRQETTLSSAAPEAKAEKSAADPDVELDFSPDGEAAANILGADDGHLDYFLGNMESASGDEEAASRRQRLFDLQRATETLQEHLLAQIPYADFSSPDDCVLAEILIANITDSGRFDGSYPDIQMATGASEKKLDAVRARILKFDPAGCGWRDPRECLLAQMDKLDDSPWEGEVRKLVAHYLPDVAAHRDAYLCEKLGLTPEELKKALAALHTLDPYPGRDRRFVPSSERPEYIHPEVHAVKRDGKWVAQVDGRDLPEIHISPKYIRMLEDPNVPSETKSYIRERVRAAEALMEAVERRQETIRQIAQEIIDAQPDFFEKGFSGLRPLTQMDIAKKVKVVDSTVSRTVCGKYMTTPFGTVELRRLFASGVTAADGSVVSNCAVKERIKALVAAEDKTRPLSDEAISKALKAEGVSVARRTVAKYRGELQIPGTAERRNMV
ncbi:MAG: RNA polymerase factor sigma-54 [Kiritimatiellae bacterium]|nr:RNA polymerase factor sigma-54 [Kiritimatiellia bacterium]